MNRRGIHLEEQPTPGIDKPELPTITLPPVKLKKYTPIKSGRTGDPETQVLELNDHHATEITQSFNESVYDSRLDHLYKSTMTITNLHRNMYPINDLVVPILGDMTHGENPFQGAKPETIKDGAKTQVFKLLPKLRDFFLSLKEQFLTVRLECVRGNHGRVSRESPATSNWDLVLYEALKLSLEPHGVIVNISNSFSKIIEIQGHKFFLFHGDQCRATMGVPFFSLTKKLMSWYVTYGGFDYALCGHFHQNARMRISSKCELFMGGSMVTDDPFALEIVGTSSIPCQWTFGVNKHKGVTWDYNLIVDDNYFPNQSTNG
jgi:predicted phosphodiesterase